MRQLLDAGEKFGNDCPEEILWQLQELRNRYHASSPIDEINDPLNEGEILNEIDELEQLYDESNNI